MGFLKNLVDAFSAPPKPKHSTPRPHFSVQVTCGEPDDGWDAQKHSPYRKDNGVRGVPSGLSLELVDTSTLPNEFAGKAYERRLYRDFWYLYVPLSEFSRYGGTYAIVPFLLDSGEVQEVRVERGRGKPFIDENGVETVRCPDFEGLSLLSSSPNHAGSRSLRQLEYVNVLLAQRGVACQEFPEATMGQISVLIGHLRSLPKTASAYRMASPDQISYAAGLRRNLGYEDNDSDLRNMRNPEISQLLDKLIAQDKADRPRREAQRKAEWEERERQEKLEMEAEEKRIREFKEANAHRVLAPPSIQEIPNKPLVKQVVNQSSYRHYQYDCPECRSRWDAYWDSYSGYELSYREKDYSKSRRGRMQKSIKIGEFKSYENTQEACRQSIANHYCLPPP